MRSTDDRGLVDQLDALVSEYLGLRAIGREARSRGYEALFADAALARRVHDLGMRAVGLSGRVADALRPVGEAQDLAAVRASRVSRRLASLLQDGVAAAARGGGTASRAEVPKPRLDDLLDALDERHPACGRGSLHDELLSAAAAARSALLVRGDRGAE